MRSREALPGGLTTGRPGPISRAAKPRRRGAECGTRAGRVWERPPVPPRPVRSERAAAAGARGGSGAGAPGPSPMPGSERPGSGGPRRGAQASQPGEQGAPRVFREGRERGAHPHPRRGRRCGVWAPRAPAVLELARWRVGEPGSRPQPRAGNALGPAPPPLALLGRPAWLCRPHGPALSARGSPCRSQARLQPRRLAQRPRPATPAVPLAWEPHWRRRPWPLSAPPPPCSPPGLEPPLHPGGCDRTGCVCRPRLLGRPGRGADGEAGPF